MMKLWCTAIGLLAASSAWAGAYEVDYARSTLAFSGSYAGKEFTGSFTQWHADIQFDDQNLKDSKIVVTIDTASAATGDAMFDSTLPLADWFDTKHYPTATFTSQTLRHLSDNRYRAEGVLTIRDRAVPIGFDFTLSRPADHRSIIQADAHYKMKRLDFLLGATSDPQAKWVSDDVAVDIHLIASVTESPQ